MIALTTLNKIRAKGPCSDGWARLLSSLGKTEADDEPLSLEHVLQSNGLYDAVWCLCAVDSCDKEARLFAADCAESVLHIFEKEYPEDTRPRLAIEAARKYANGLISEDALDAANDAARDLAHDLLRKDVFDAAWDAAWSAGRAAGRAVSWAAAWTAGSAAACYGANDAALAASWASSWSAASAAEKEKQKHFFIKYFCTEEN